MMISLSAVIEHAEAWARVWEKEADEYTRLSKFAAISESPTADQDADRYELDAAHCWMKANTVREFARAVAQSSGVVA